MAKTVTKPIVCQSQADASALKCSETSIQFADERKGRSNVKRGQISCLIAIGLTAGSCGAAPLLSGHMVGGGFYNTPNCMGSTSVVGGATGSLDCSGPGTTGQGSWVSEFGRLRVSAHATANDAPSEPGNDLTQYITMQGSARMDDEIIFASIRPASVVLFVTETWTQTNHYPRGLAPNEFMSDLFLWGGLRNCPDELLRSNAIGSFSQTRSVTCEVASSGVVNLAYVLTARATVENPNFPSGGLFSGSALLDASHTGEITGLQFFDTAGNDITSTIPFTTGSGTVYPLGDPTSSVAVPVPASLALLGVGLAGLAAVRRKWFL